MKQRFAIPLEAALAGLPEVRRVCSNSQLSVAQVSIEFMPQMDGGEALKKWTG